MKKILLISLCALIMLSAFMIPMSAAVEVTQNYTAEELTLNINQNNLFELFNGETIEITIYGDFTFPNATDQSIQNSHYTVIKINASAGDVHCEASNPEVLAPSIYLWDGLSNKIFDDLSTIIPYETNTFVMADWTIDKGETVTVSDEDILLTYFEGWSVSTTPDPPPTDDNNDVGGTLEVFTSVVTFIPTMFTTLTPIFYADNSLTILGVLIVAALAIGIILLLINKLCDYLKFRG